MKGLGHNKIQGVAKRQPLYLQIRKRLKRMARQSPNPSHLKMSPKPDPLPSRGIQVVHLNQTSIMSRRRGTIATTKDGDQHEPIVGHES